MTEHIATAALLVDGEVWTLPRPTRHHTLVHAWCSAHFRDGENGRLGQHDQGFVTNTGRYVDRHEARRIAVAAGQLIERASNLPRLYSEDVW